jgi:mannose-6-phosphate isomerase-like protein (cupin superfamily)
MRELAMRLPGADAAKGSPEAHAGDAILSIAHDFNNLVGVIHGYVELLAMSNLDAAQQRQVDAIRGAAEQTGQLSQKLSGYARALDARSDHGEDASMIRSADQAFDLASTYVVLGANDGVATRIDVDASFWSTVDDRDDLREGRLVGLYRSSTDWDHWEMHPHGEEVLVLVSGAMEMVLERDGGESTVELRPGQACIVPRGTWHRARVREPSALLTITAGRGTQHRPLAR